MVVKKIQLGKRGITDNFIKTLQDHFKKYWTLKISVLKNSDRKQIKEFSEEIIEKLEGTYKVRIIGFTIVLKRQKKKTTLKKIS